MIITIFVVTRRSTNHFQLLLILIPLTSAEHKVHKTKGHSPLHGFRTLHPPPIKWKPPPPHNYTLS